MENIEQKVTEYMGVLRNCLTDESLICDPEELGAIIFELTEFDKKYPKTLDKSKIRVIERVSLKYGII